MGDAVRVVKKKVRPYPIAATLDVAGAKKPIEILRLDAIGVIIRCTDQFLKIGEHVGLYFILPVSHAEVSTPARITRTYDKVVDIKDRKVERMAELQFEGLTKPQKDHIVAFIRAIGQK